jgi:hypothetical protein
MRSLVNDIIASYFSEQKQKLNLPETQKSIWQINTWSVYQLQEF